MRTATVTNTRMLVALPLAAVGLFVAAFALASGARTRGKVLAALEKPAAPAPSQRHVAIARSGPYRVLLQIGPNRASVANEMSLRISKHGRPLTGARTTVVFSMPAMNMRDGYTSRTTQRPDGSYVASLPVLGMSGTWQLHVQVRRPGARAITVTFNDRLGA